MPTYISREGAVLTYEGWLQRRNMALYTTLMVDLFRLPGDGGASVATQWEGVYGRVYITRVTMPGKGATIYSQDENTACAAHWQWVEQMLEDLLPDDPVYAEAEPV